MSKAQKKLSGTKGNPDQAASPEVVVPRVTLRDIAEKIGVSRMTVSLALRGAPHVAKSTRRKILEVAQELGFSPDARVAKLMSDLAHLRKTPNYRGELVFLTTSWQSEFGWKDSYHFSGCFHGAEQRALELGYRLTPFWMRDPRFLKKSLPDIIWARGIRGIIIAPSPAEDSGIPDVNLDSDWKRFCMVQLGVTLVSPALNLVRSNYFQAMHHTIRQLEARGYRRIGYAIVHRGDILSSCLWTAAYLHWRNRRGLDANLPGFGYPWGAFPEDRFHDWIRNHAIEAVVAMHGEPYPAIKRVQKALGRHVGFSVLDHPGGKSPFSGIEQNAPELGRAAVNQLVHAINHDLTGFPEHPCQTSIEGIWHEAGSTRKLPGGPLSPSEQKAELLNNYF